MQNPSTTSSSAESCLQTVKDHEVKMLLLEFFFYCWRYQSFLKCLRFFTGLIYSEMWLQSHEKRSAHYCKLRPSGTISVKPVGFNILAILTSNNNPHNLLIRTNLKLMTLRNYFLLKTNIQNPFRTQKFKISIFIFNII